MFEQSVLRPARVRGWAVTVGFMGELVAVGGILVVPLIWPQLLPRAATITLLMSPVMPPATPKPVSTHSVRTIREYPAPFFIPVSVRLPSSTPAQALPDPAPQLHVEGQMVTSDDTARLRNLLNSDGPPPPIRPPAPPVPSTPKPGPIEPKAIRVSGPVEEALLIHRVDPVYPRLAQQVRVSGTVELNGIIGTDGRIRELRAVSGHPLLVPAALDAVRQWVYRPTVLNGASVEVITTITVIFKLR